MSGIIFIDIDLKISNLNAVKGNLYADKQPVKRAEKAKKIHIKSR